MPHSSHLIHTHPHAECYVRNIIKRQHYQTRELLEHMPKFGDQLYFGTHTHAHTVSLYSPAAKYTPPSQRPTDLNVLNKIEFPPGKSTNEYMTITTTTTKRRNKSHSMIEFHKINSISLQHDGGWVRCLIVRFQHFEHFDGFPFDGGSLI